MLFRSLTILSGLPAPLERLLSAMTAWRIFAVKARGSFARTLIALVDSRIVRSRVRVRRLGVAYPEWQQQSERK